jgi:2'-5' RNA ligase
MPKPPTGERAGVADIPRLGKPAPGVSPVGAQGYWAGNGVDAWLATEDDQPVGYLRNTDNPDVSVRLDHVQAWGEIVDSLGLHEAEVPTVDTPPPSAPDGSGAPAGDPAADPADPAADPAAAGGQPPAAPAAQPAPADAEPDPEADPDAGKEVAEDTKPAPDDPDAADEDEEKKRKRQQSKTLPAADADDTGPEDEYRRTGIMVALMVPDGEGADLGLDHQRATPTGDLHITLAYLGSSEDVDDHGKFVEDMLGAVREVAARYDPLAGEINGFLRWWSPDGDVIAYTWDCPDLPQFRQDLIEALTEAGLEPNKDHGFTPHMTLAYLAEGEDTPMRRVTPKQMAFTTVTVVFGENRIEVPLDDTADEDDDLMVLRGDIPDSTAPSAQDQYKGIAHGAFVRWAGGVGRVDLLVTAGEVPGVDGVVTGTKTAPAARVRVHERGGRGWQATGNRVAVKVADLQAVRPPALADQPTSLTELVADYAAVAEAKHLRMPDLYAVQAVWARGRDSWPGDAVIATADDWALGRVDAFLRKALGAEVPAAYVGDDDLLQDITDAYAAETPGEVLGDDVEVVEIDDDVKSLLHDLGA